MKQKKAVVFEEIRNFHILAILYSLLVGYKVYFLRLSPQQRLAKKWAGKFLQKGFIAKLAVDYRINDIYEDCFYDKSFDNIDIFFGQCNHRFIASMIKIYDSDEVTLSFKNKLNRELARFYYLNTIAGRVSAALSGADIYFVPTDGIYWHRTNKEEATLYGYYFKRAVKINAQFCHVSLKMIWWSKLEARLIYFLRRLFIYAKVALLIPAAILIFLFALFRKKSRKSFSYGVMLTYPPRDLSDSDRRLDFLLDGVNIRKDNTIFIHKKILSQENKLYLTKNGFKFVSVFFDSIGWQDLRRVFSPGIIDFFMYGRGHTNTILDIYLNLLYSFLKWSSFTNQHKINNFITSGDYGAEAIARNVILKKKTGAVIWYYIDAVNNDNFYKSFDIPDSDRMGFYGFLNYDYLISWSKCISGYFISHHHRIRADYAVGPLWSEHIREYQQGLRQSRKIGRIAAEKREGKYKIIAVFDSGYHDERRNSYDEGLQFAKGIKRLLEQNEDFFVIFKEKKPRSRIAEYNEELLDVYNELEKHSRTIFPLSATSPSEVSAFSDIVISFPFTSPTIEAIAAKKKAIYFDPSGQFKGSYYDRFPGFVCHGYSELERRIKELLSTDEFSYEAYLNKYIVPSITPYLDATGITRFRKLLRGSD